MYLSFKSMKKRRVIKCVLDKILSEREMNQEELSIAIGASRESIRKLRTNSSELLPRTLINNICNYLDIRLCDLFTSIEVKDVSND